MNINVRVYIVQLPTSLPKYDEFVENQQGLIGTGRFLGG